MIAKPTSCNGCAFSCSPLGSMQGWVPADGTGDNGVLVVLDAPREDDAAEGVPTVSKMGYFMWQNLKRIGIEREGFRVHNVLSCAPSQPKWQLQSYTGEVVRKCSPNLRHTIVEHVSHAKRKGKTPVVLTLGRLAFTEVMGLDTKDPLLKLDYIGYPHWQSEYGCWVFAADHPADLMRGQTHLLPVMQFVFQRALEVAEQGLVLDEGKDYLLNPTEKVFGEWVDTYFTYLAKNPDTYLSFDIETPHKKGMDEAGLAKDQDDFVILQCSFAYKPGEAVSVPWNAQYRAQFERIFAGATKVLGWNSMLYDVPRIQAQMPIRGDHFDAMLAWHILNSALPKGLGFVTPFYVHNTGMWKHLSDAQPAFYNAKDADMALRNFLGTKADLQKSGQWPVFEDHCAIHKVFNFMSDQGVHLDKGLRQEAEDKLAGQLTELEGRMEEVVPPEAKKLKVFKKVPKVTDGMEQVAGFVKANCCPNCGATMVKAAHFKSVGKKKLSTCWECGESLKKHCPLGHGHDDKCKKHHHDFVRPAENPCHGFKAVKQEVPTLLWGQRLDFKLSKQGLEGYQAIRGHKPIKSRVEKKVTFDERAILQLLKKYPEDQLYPLILQQRKLQKLLGTYIGVTNPLTKRVMGGLEVGPDGKVHTVFTSNPSTLRSASQNPNLQNIPRPNKDKNDSANLIRALFTATPGHTLLARDFSGIEAKLVGWLAGAKDYVRLTAIDVHSFYTAYAINALDGRIRSADLPQLSWDDDRLKAHLAAIKDEFKSDRNNLYKHLVHAINFGQGAKGAQEKILSETGVVYPLETIQRVMDLYKELFPEIPRWHQACLLQVEKDGYLKNPFGYVHRFSRPFEYENVGGQWQRKQGPDANAIWAFGAQSTAAGIIKAAMLRLYNERFEECGQWLRLLIHDELFLDVPEELADAVDVVLAEEMERPIPEMPVPASWGMGEYLMVGTEGKRGPRWSEMH